jgi:hypothetical protein
MRKLGVASAIAVLTLGVGAGSATVWARAQKVPRLHGVDFSLQVSTNTAFCLEEENDGSIIVSTCAPKDEQHVTFTENPDNTNVLVLGDGRCLDRGNGRLGTLLRAAPCDFGATQRFQYRTTGKLSDPALTSCVVAAQPAQGAQVFDDRCHVSLGGGATEIFILSR